MSEPIDTKNHPIVKALIQHQSRLGDISDVTFARRYIGVSSASWSLMKSGTYPARDPQKMLKRCEAALQMLNDEADKAGSSSANAKIIELAHVRAALNAVTGCYGEAQNRLVVNLAPSGGGKTTLVRKLKENYLGGLACAEATETWRNSYLNALVSVAESIGITETFTTTRAAETAVIDLLAVTPRVLAIDEGHYCGPEALNMLKMILNKTQTRIVLLAIPQLWKRLEGKAYDEALQLRRRTYAKIVVEEVTLTDCRKFLEANLPGFDRLTGEEKVKGTNADPKKAVVGHVCAAAHRFGLYDTCTRICREVSDEIGDGELTVETVVVAIKRAEALSA